VVSSELEPIFEGADAVVHLAWAIRPSHDAETLKRINVDGSRRVFEAAARAAPDLLADDELQEAFAAHLRQTEEHERLVRERLEARGADPSAAKDLALRIGGMQVGAFFAAQPDTNAKLSGFASAFEHLEIAAYELLERVEQLARRWDLAVSPSRA
jgi:uncharacterized protein DUF892